MRRPMVALAFAVAFGGALAYAATGGRHWFERTAPATDISDDSDTNLRSNDARPGSTPASESLQRPNLRTNEPPASAPTEGAKTGEPGNAAGTTSAVPGATNGSATGGARTPTGAGAASSWRAVDQALLARDDARAERALSGLATSGDPTTRAKAELGLAQLAKSRGNCDEARRHALAAKAVAGADSAVVRRAETIAQSCR